MGSIQNFISQTKSVNFENIESLSKSINLFWLKVKVECKQWRSFLNQDWFVFLDNLLMFPLYNFMMSSSSACSLMRLGVKYILLVY